MKKSQLHNIKETGFKTPDAYFDTFNQRLIEKLAVQKDMASITSSGYKVPENYFENFDAKLQARLKINEKSKVIPFMSWRNIAYISGVAAVLILMLTVFLQSDNPLSINQVETAYIEDYLNGENLNIDDFASLLTDDDLIFENFVTNSLSEESLENYLLNNASIEDLIFGK